VFSILARTTSDMQITDAELKGIDDYIENIKQFDLELQRRDPEEMWFANLITALLSAMLRESERKPRRQDEDEMARFKAHPKVQQEVEQMLDAHWRNWVDTPLPALGDQTPREAVQDADGRAMVMALLDDMERREQSQGSGLKQQKYIDRARTQLGLHG